MLGGVVVEVSEIKNHHGILYVRVADKPYSHYEYCGLTLFRDAASEAIDFGDALWWRGKEGMWTPWGYKQSTKTKGGRDYDIRVHILSSGKGIVHPDLKALKQKDKRPK